MTNEQTLEEALSLQTKAHLYIVSLKEPAYKDAERVTAEAVELIRKHKYNLAEEIDEYAS